MSTSTAAPETVIKNLQDLFCLFVGSGEILLEPVECAHCGYDKAFEKFGSDYLCESCISMIGCVLGGLEFGVERDEDGNVSVIA